MKDGEIAAVDDGAGLFRRSAQGYGLPAEIVADGEQKIDFAQNSAGVHGGDTIADTVDVGSNAHGDDGNGEGFANLERGIAVRIKKELKMMIGGEAADVRQQDTSGHPAVERPGDQWQRSIVVVAGVDVRRL